MLGVGDQYAVFGADGLTVRWREPFDQLAELAAEPEHANGRKQALSAERPRWLPLLDRVRTWATEEPRKFVGEAGAALALVREVPALGVAMKGTRGLAELQGMSQQRRRRRR